MVEQLKIFCNGENYILETYNRIAVAIKKDGFINATIMCNQFNRRFEKIFEYHSWQAYYEEFCKEYYGSPETGDPLYLSKKYIAKVQGTYVDQRIINYISFWVSPRYAIYVGIIMDIINDKAYEVLNEKQLPDTVENAKPVFVEFAKSIATTIDRKFVNKPY